MGKDTNTDDDADTEGKAGHNPLLADANDRVESSKKGTAARKNSPLSLAFEERGSRQDSRRSRRQASDK